MTDRPKLAALAVLLHDGKALLARRRNPPDAGLWGFPGGHVERGETALTAAARELREETGVVAEPLRYLRNLDVILRDESGAVAHHFFMAAVLCRYRAGAPAAQDDVIEAAWIPVARALDGGMPMSRDVDAVLRDALAATGRQGALYQGL